MSQQAGPRIPGQGDWGIAVPALLITFAVALVGFWPAMVWHGYTDTGGWRWDIHSTIAEAVYFGVIGFTAGLVALGNRDSRRAVTVTPDRPPPPPPSVVADSACKHPRAVRVENITNPDETVAYLCPDCDSQLDEERKPS